VSSEEEYLLRLVEYNGQEFGLCTCKGYTHHEGPCAHLCYVRRQAAVDTSLMPAVDEDPQTEDLTDEVDVVETNPNEDGGDEPDQKDVVDVDPVENDDVQEADRADHAAPPTPQADRTSLERRDDQDVENLDEFVTEIAGVPDVFVVEMGRGRNSKPYVTKAGLNYIAHEQGIQTRAEPISPSWDEPNDMAAYRGIAVDDDGREYQDVATAHVDEVRNTVGEENLDELASTRATNRALRLATGCGFASVEEIESDRALEGHDPEQADVATDGGERR
jgi:hypothetical protein